MYYIDKYIKFNRRNFTRAHMGPPILVFIAFFGITLWSWVDLKQNIQQEKSQILTNNTDNTAQAIIDRFNSYEDVLRAGAGLFGASDNVTRSEWREFINSFDLPNSYPGIQGIGYIKNFGPEEIEAHQAAIRTEGIENYTIRPADPRPNYTSVVFIEPMSEKNQSVLGYDMQTEDKRATAMHMARDSGKVGLSDKVTLIQEVNDQQETQSGFVMFMPIYINNLSLADTASRQANLDGYIYAQLRAGDLLSGILNDDNPNFGFRIYDSPSSGDNSLIYETASFNRIAADKSRQMTSQTIQLANKQWLIESAVNPEVISGRERNRPAATLWGGVLFSAFLAIFIHLLLVNRSRVLADKEKKEIEYAKDELLALASHQLRTPATGVKQYIGMLREGYGGKISPRQRQLLDKAYSSNERQLGAINDMLFVARADTGNINYNKQKTDLSALLNDIVDEQLGVIKSRQQNLIQRIPARPIYAEVDGQFLRMAVENILSNASKYTPEDGQITVSLKKRSKTIELIVADNGVGVSEKDYPLLFQKFSRIPNDLTNKVSGSGIGLYLAKKVVEAHRGNISFNSTPGEGSVCVIILPIKIKSKKKL